MDESFESLPPYPGVSLPLPESAPAAPPLPGPSRRWLGPALGGGAVLLAVAAFALGRATPHQSTNTATNLGALTAATSPAAPASGASCVSPRRVASGTLKAINGSTLTVTNAKGTAITVKTDSNTKVTAIVKGSLGDVTKGATVVVEGTSSGTGAATAITASHVDIAGITLPASPAGGARVFGPGPKGTSGLALGTVESVSSSGFTLSSGGNTITVTASSSTVFAKAESIAASALTIGQPIAITGTPNSDGSITALTIEQADSSLGKLPAFGLVPAVFGGPASFGGPGGFGFGPLRLGPFARRGPGGPPATATPPTTTP